MLYTHISLYWGRFHERTSLSREPDSNLESLTSDSKIGGIFGRVHCFSLSGFHKQPEF